MDNLESFAAGESKPIFIDRLLSECCQVYEQPGYDLDTGLCSACHDHTKYVLESEFYDES